MSPEIIASERRLVERVLNGDQLAARELYEAHAGAVRRIAFRIAGGEDADDVAQETFLRIFRKLRGFRHESLLRTWISRAAVNTAFHWRRGQKTQLRLFAVSLEENPELGGTVEANPESDITAARMRALLARELTGMKPAMRDCLLDQACGLSLAETAAHLGKTVAAVKTLRLRARLEIKRRCGVVSGPRLAESSVA